ncbi:MAG TPA: UTP--glucose-1-phosphate uridylyltransferase [Spirochaetia bacterium]|nr:UTP--glucose-1-phosphate uridylyltransferase [Spirochaetia bacterium]
MLDGTKLTPELRDRFERTGIDAALTFHILEAFNAGRYTGVEPVHVSSLPVVDGKTILDLTGAVEWRAPSSQVRERIGAVGLDVDLERYARREGSTLIFDRASLQRLGEALLPAVSYGILNGGSATSYTDIVKNTAFSERILEICREPFDAISEIAGGRAKGITPAFVHPDGTAGPSYLELKLRALLIQVLRGQQADGARSASDEPSVLFPMFQMTSINNDAEVQRALEEYRASPMLAELIERTGVDMTRVLTGVQPLIAAYTHSSEGSPKRVFTRAYGESNAILPLPGGHGQNFLVLSSIYRELHRRGKRFIQLGNVDNLGNTVDPVEVALLALSGKQAGFDFSFKTPVDVKGGILVVEQHGRLDCADIGPAISHEEVAEAESRGTPILFNCATGLFDLSYLVGRLDDIVERLPMRWSDQEKDAGRYSQAEQVTWEIIAMLDDFFIFGVDKYRRFLAAKLLLECLMTSGIGLDDPRYPTDPDSSKDLSAVARRLHGGLTEKLAGVYGMVREGGRWRPQRPDELLRHQEDVR